MNKLLAPACLLALMLALLFCGCSSNNPSRSDQQDRAYYEALEEQIEKSNSVSSYELVISDVSISSSSVFTSATGKLTNTGKSSVSFVKVKGQFKNSSGSIIDTDWTYAVGAEGLSPGESTKFEIMVDKDRSIKECSCSILDYVND